MRDEHPDNGRIVAEDTGDALAVCLGGDLHEELWMWHEEFRLAVDSKDGRQAEILAAREEFRHVLLLHTDDAQTPLQFRDDLSEASLQLLVP